MSIIPPKISEEKIRKIWILSDQDLTQSEIGRRVGVSRATVAKYIREGKIHFNPKFRNYLKELERATTLESFLRLLGEMILDRLEKK